MSLWCRYARSLDHYVDMERASLALNCCINDGKNMDIM